MKRILSILIASSLCLCILAGCGWQNAYQSNHTEEDFYEGSIEEAFEDDTITKQVYQIVDNYNGNKKDTEYQFIKTLVSTENIRQICLIDIASYSLRVESAKEMLAIFDEENASDQEEIKTYTAQRDEAQKKKDDLETLLPAIIELEETIIKQIENGVTGTDEIPEAPTTEITGSML